MATVKHCYKRADLKQYKCVLIGFESEVQIKVSAEVHASGGSRRQSGLFSFPVSGALWLYHST